MRIQVHFRTLVLVTLASLLTLVTAIWGAVVYRSIHDIILAGFDRKLLAVAGSAAVFTNGDAHAAYQRPFDIRSLSPGPDGQLLGYDANRQSLVLIDPADGGALPLDGMPLGALRSVAYDAGAARWAALGVDGLSVYQGSSPVALQAEAQPPASDFEQLLFREGRLYARKGRILQALDDTEESVTLGSEVAVLGVSQAPAAWLGLSEDGRQLLWFGADGVELRRVTLGETPAPILGLAQIEQTIYAASTSLLRLDGESGAVQQDFAEWPGYYTERDPFFQRYVGAYQRIREAAGLTFLYTEVHLGSDQIRYILDGSIGDDHSPPGFKDTVPPESVADVALAQTQGRAFVSAVRQWEEWGLVKVSAEPIYNRDGQVVALAGADVNIGVIRDKTRNALFAVIFVGVGLLILAGYVSLQVAQGLTEPLWIIKNSALRIAAGEQGVKADYHSDDEIGQLALRLSELSERLQAQGRRSLAYQEALLSGRIEIALKHALHEMLDWDSGPWLVDTVEDPQGEMKLRAGGYAANAERCVFWQTDEQGSELERHARQLRLQTLVQTLGAQIEEPEHRRAVFGAEPGLQALAIWHHDGCIRVYARERMRLTIRSHLGLVRGTVAEPEALIELAPGERLIWPGGIRAHGSTQAEEVRA